MPCAGAWDSVDVNVPVYTGPKGLPIGVRIVGRYGSDTPAELDKRIGPRPGSSRR